MSQEIKNDSNVESLINLLYLISDALHLAEDGSGGGLESTLEIREILSDAQLRTTTLLARASQRQSRFPKEPIVDGSKLGKKLVLVSN